MPNSLYILKINGEFIMKNTLENITYYLANVQYKGMVNITRVQNEN